MSGAATLAGFKFTLDFLVTLLCLAIVGACIGYCVGSTIDSCAAWLRSRRRSRV